MTESEQNKNTVRAYVEAFNRGDLDALKRLFTPDAMIQGVLGKAPIEEALGIWRELHESYGIELTVGAVVAEGNQVAACYTERGTFRKAFRGAEPTGKSYSVTAMEWFRLENGRIAERWGARDSAAIDRQVHAA